MPDFSNSLIYKIVCKDSCITEMYIGSSYDIHDRTSKHKSSCNNTNDDHYNTPVYKFIRKHGGWDNWTIVVLYKYPCNSKQELEEEERRAYDKFICDFVLLNGRKPYQSEEERREYGNQKSKEWYQNNLEKARQSARDRAEANKEKNQTPEKCECGLMISHGNMLTHKKNDKHKDRMKKLAQGIEIDDTPKTKKKECECGAVVTNLNRHKKHSCPLRDSSQNNVNKK